MSQKPRVLLVDDDPDALMLLEAVLDKDHLLATASDGREALERLAELHPPPDLVICDLNMPGMGGQELVTHLRKDPRLATVPVILLTGHDSAETRLDMLEAGVSDYVTKPFPPSELRLRVRNILRDAVLLRQVQEARLETEAANRELREINVELDRFAAAAAHDIQAPLANIAGYAHLLQDGVVDDPEQAKKLLGAIGENADRAIVLVRELLNHARTVMSSDAVDAVDLGKVVDEVTDHLATAIKEAGAALEIASPLGYIQGRRVAIESLMLNLISNAVKYRAPDRAPVIKISTASASDPGWVEIVVRDNGRGLPEDQRERVFGLGAQGNTQESGTGIGLATVRAVVSRHGGTIRLEDSPLPGGLTVRLRLPAA